MFSDDRRKNFMFIFHLSSGSQRKNNKKNVFDVQSNAFDIKIKHPASITHNIFLCYFIKKNKNTFLRSKIKL